MEKHVDYRINGSGDDRNGSASRDQGRRTERTLWARSPHQSRHGRCVALKVCGDVVSVGIASAPAVIWMPVQKVMAESEAEAWLKSGF
jgi:hypothetical protein